MLNEKPDHAGEDDNPRRSLFRRPLPDIPRRTLPDENEPRPVFTIGECGRLVAPVSATAELVGKIQSRLLDAEQWGWRAAEKEWGYVAPSEHVGKGMDKMAPPDAEQDLSISLQSPMYLGDACIWWAGRGKVIPEDTLDMLSPKLQRQLDGGSRGRTFYYVDHKRRYVAGPAF